MNARIHQLRDKSGETEKITINLGYVDLGRIDLLVQEGFYSNRSDFIRTAIRNQIATHEETVNRSLDRQTMELGLREYTRADLETVRAAGERLHIKVVGLARIASDVSAELAEATIASLTVLGALQASPEVKSRTGRADQVGHAPPNKDTTDEHFLRCRHAAGVEFDARLRSGRGHHGHTTRSCGRPARYLLPIVGTGNDGRDAKGVASGKRLPSGHRYRP